MKSFTRRILLAMLLLSATQAYAEKSFMVSPSLGRASINNIKGYGDANFLRVDGSFYPVPEFGLNVFAAQYGEFKSNVGTNVAIKLNGYGVGAMGRWLVSEYAQPYVRADYMFWNAEASAFGRSLSKDKGGSPGLALGVQFPIKRMFGVKAEVAGYNNISGANVRQFFVGLTLRF